MFDISVDLDSHVHSRRPARILCYVRSRCLQVVALECIFKLAVQCQAPHHGITPFLKTLLRRLAPQLILFPNQQQLSLNNTGIYNSSITPSDQPWNTYNYCNAPHVNSQHYLEPQDSEATLEYLNVIIRHHKVRSCFLQSHDHLFFCLADP